MMKKLKEYISELRDEITLFLFSHPYLVHCVNMWPITLTGHLNGFSRMMHNMALRILTRDNGKSVKPQYLQFNAIPMSALGEIYHALFM